MNYEYELGLLVISDNESKSEDNEDGMPPIETFMNVSVKLRKEHLFAYIKCGDIVIGSVQHVNEQRMLMQMICFDINKKRDCTRLKFNVSMYMPFFYYYA